MQKLCKKIINLETDEGNNRQFEILLVPGGMIVYRTCFLPGYSTTPMHTATYVPIGPADRDSRSLMPDWLYGDDVDK